jgi:hypothetical protein
MTTIAALGAENASLRARLVEAEARLPAAGAGDGTLGEPPSAAVLHQLAHMHGQVLEVVGHCIVNELSRRRHANDPDEIPRGTAAKFASIRTLLEQAGAETDALDLPPYNSQLVRAYRATLSIPEAAYFEQIKAKTAPDPGALNAKLMTTTTSAGSTMVAKVQPRPMPARLPTAAPRTAGGPSGASIPPPTLRWTLADLRELSVEVILGAIDARGGIDVNLADGFATLVPSFNDQATNMMRQHLVDICNHVRFMRTGNDKGWFGHALDGQSAGRVGPDRSRATAFQAAVLAAWKTPFLRTVMPNLLSADAQLALTSNGGTLPTVHFDTVVRFLGKTYCHGDDIDAYGFLVNLEQQHVRMASNFVSTYLQKPEPTEGDGALEGDNKALLVETDREFHTMLQKTGGDAAGVHRQLGQLVGLNEDTPVGKGARQGSGATGGFLTPVDICSPPSIRL